MKKKLNWYALDTSAKIYPAIESSKNPAIFRLSMCLTHIIDENILLSALNEIKHRFPYYNVHIKNGLFWHYLEQNNHELLVWHDTPSPCERIFPRFNNGYLYKVKFYGKTIALEMFHVLTDGSGALEFLKCLVNQYLWLSKKITGKTPGIIDIKQKPTCEEYTDAFLTVLEKNPDIPNINKGRTLFSSSKSFKTSGRSLPGGTNKVITGIVCVDDIKVAAKQYDLTITQLLVALNLEALIHLQAKQIKDKNKHKHVSIQVPVNMRNWYPTTCMRNFSLFVMPRIDPRKITQFEDIAIEVKRFMAQYLSKEYLLSMVHENCSLAKNKVLMHVPSPIKNLAISYISKTQSSTQYSGTISNLGVITLPENMKAHVENMLVFVGPSSHDRCTCGVLGYEGNIYITFGRNIKETYIEKHIFRRLVKMGVDVKLKSNL